VFFLGACTGIDQSTEEIDPKKETDSVTSAAKHPENGKEIKAGPQIYQGKLASFERMEYEAHRIKFEDGKIFKIDQESYKLIELAENAIGKSVQLNYEIVKLEDAVELFSDGERVPKGENSRIETHRLTSFEFELSYEADAVVLLTFENGEEEYLRALKSESIKKFKEKYSTKVIDKRNNEADPEHFVINFEQPITVNVLYKTYEVEEVKNIEIKS